MTLPEAPFVAIEDLSFRYPQASHPALAHIDIALAEGTFALVAGASGSGKSTLLRSLNGLVPHFSGGTFGGAVRVGGMDTREHPPRAMSAMTGFVFQDPEAQLLTDRVDDEIAFSLEQHGVPPVVMRKRVEEMLDVLGIAGLRERSPATLSGGERQRVAVAAALALHPRLLALDEPTSQLDPWGAEDVLAALSRLNEDLGLTIVMAEHRLERTLGHADTVIHLGADGHSESGPTRRMVTRLPQSALPPVTRLGLALGWSGPPLTIKEGRQVAGGLVLPTRPDGDDARPGTPGDVRIELDHVTVALGGRDVIRDVSLRLREGEIVALMGRNGSGKSTLLRTMLGLERPRKGRVLIDGVDRTGQDPANLNGALGYIPQRPDAMFFHDRLVDEVRYSMRLRGIAGQPEAWLERFGLRDLAMRHPRDLSGGERERAALATIMAGQPRALLLDEPTRGMDARHKQELMQILDGLREAGVTVVLATHDVEMVASHATRVVLLGDREVIADGPPREVLSDSLTFTTQVNKLYGGSWLTVDEVLAAVQRR
ncbi:MAG TPA: ATP-binding cassette domain-containing protein [Thermomicrobiales bacterium]|nr:ATP-binding cassette domain-containing protein [Thermomicrobiales bacterium]